MEFQVFVHGKDVVENVLSDARDDAHLVRVVQFALKGKITVTAGRRRGQRCQETRRNALKRTNGY